MVGFLLVLIGAALAIEAHRRGRTPSPRSLRIAVAAFLLGLIGQCALFLVLTPIAAPGTTTLLAMVSAALGLEAVRRGAVRPCVDLANSIAAEVRAFEGEDNPAADVTLLLARRV